MVNMDKTRPRYAEIIQKLALGHGKMAFIAGARQVGKTTLALQIGKKFKTHFYYNWDDLEFKKKWAKSPGTLFPDTVGEKPLIILDELHKAPRWKSTLKGLYDTRKDRAGFVVTGSARLDIYRRGGDSMLGRYFLFRLHPFSVGELNAGLVIKPDDLSLAIEKTIQPSKNYAKLFSFGGFPDPFLTADKNYHNVWRQSRLERLVREDLVDLSRLRETGLMQTLMAMLPEKVGSPLSVQSLAEDLQSNHPTITRWLSWLEQIYYAYTIVPFAKNIAQALKKQPKLYLWDWSEVTDDEARFENMVAGHFLKAVHYWNDTGEGSFALHYVRNKQKQEADFLVTRNNKPWLLAECKMSDQNINSSFYDFIEALKPQVALQIVHESGCHKRFECAKMTQGYVISADRFLNLLP